jgi:hypothetical protein
MKSKMIFFVILLVLALTFSFMTNSEAAEKKGSPFKELCLKILGLSKKTVEKEVSAVGRGIKKGADVVVQEGKDIGALVTGDGSKAKDILVKPVKGATEMVGETTYDVINAPIEAGKEVAEEDIK